MVKNIVSLPMTCTWLGWVEMWGSLGHDKLSMVISEHKQKFSSEITLIKPLCLKGKATNQQSIGYVLENWARHGCNRRAGRHLDMMVE